MELETTLPELRRIDESSSSSTDYRRPGECCQEEIRRKARRQSSSSTPASNTLETELFWRSVRRGSRQILCLLLEVK